MNLDFFVFTLALTALASGDYRATLVLLAFMAMCLAYSVAIQFQFTQQINCYNGGVENLDDNEDSGDSDDGSEDSGDSDALELRCEETDLHAEGTVCDDCPQIDEPTHK
jgi:hypothetical protein